ncbi:kyphoscoliosis peptidase-like isoform X1 [Dreissena polymorpha]|uniref:Transglutaminase-like domain-containing protein n=1 Tax=Dreissena polymorpha TaxID=45954 RepID=A0A9D4C0E2_DREPO|nr:kyphoscoliosis peptidase-like isoform X1 [Dreissena polymorpha]KAH3714957.1 hypothetical protein DPMN_057660 [Dreissena polymorpha]
MGCCNSKTVSDKYKSREIKQNEKGKSEFGEIDDYARKAPEELKTSAEALVQYMLSKTKDHRQLVRGFFVWIAENIEYDIEGLLGQRPRTPTDVSSVMKNGLSVCEGYASVMETLCSSAGREVKKLSGFSKGLRYSTDKKITTSSATDHAWNAVRLDGKWFLLDSTWGAGYSDGRKFIKAFNEFFFLTDPDKFVNDHFPYMNHNMSESMKWQLLKNPISLEDFNNNVQLKSHAFLLNVTPVSHKRGHIVMNDEIQLTFKSQNILRFSASLSHFDGNFIREMLNSTFVNSKSGVSFITVHPRIIGKYRLDIFAQHRTDEGSLHQVAVYSIQCDSVKDTTFEFPKVFKSDYTDECQIIQPRSARLLANSEVVFKINAPHLNSISVNDEMLQGKGGIFRGTIKTHKEGVAYIVNAVFREGLTTHFRGMFQF